VYTLLGLGVGVGQALICNVHHHASSSYELSELLTKISKSKMHGLNKNDGTLLEIQVE
jgi:hypothetical protein